MSNLMEDIRNLMEQGFSEESAREITIMNNYNIPLENMI